MTDKTIAIPIYDFLIRVIISDTYEEFEQDVFDAGYEDGCRGAGMIVFQDSKKMTLVINREDISYGNVAHESAHITNRIWRDINAQWSFDNDEPYCYLLGFITDCIHQIIAQ